MLKTCCTSTQKLGCVISCECIETGLVAAQTGAHVIEYQKPGGGVVTATVSFTASDAINFTNYFAEAGVGVFKIKQPDGVYFTNSGNDCFSIEVVPGQTKTADVCS